MENETTETLTSQIELEKLATEFKTTHSERQALITQWEETIAKLKRRDEELIDEEEKNIKVIIIKIKKILLKFNSGQRRVDCQGATHKRKTGLPDN